jgi:DNA-binding FadR family transcriptional regulator
MVREATRKLAQKRLVEIQHGRGVRAVIRLHQPLEGSLALPIPNLVDRLQALIETRLTIELETAAQVARRATRAQVTALQRVHQRMLEADNDNEGAEADCAFHEAVAEANGNLIYRLILESLADLSLANRVRTIRHVGKGTAFGHHEKILEALPTRDAAGAREPMHADMTAVSDDLKLPSLQSASPGTV